VMDGEWAGNPSGMGGLRGGLFLAARRFWGLLGMDG